MPIYEDHVEVRIHQYGDAVERDKHGVLVVDRGGFPEQLGADEVKVGTFEAHNWRNTRLFKYW